MVKIYSLSSSGVEKGEINQNLGMICLQIRSSILFKTYVYVLQKNNKRNIR